MECTEIKTRYLSGLGTGAGYGARVASEAVQNQGPGTVRKRRYVPSLAPRPRILQVEWETLRNRLF